MAQQLDPNTASMEFIQWARQVVSEHSSDGRAAVEALDAWRKREYDFLKWGLSCYKFELDEHGKPSLKLAILANYGPTSVLNNSCEANKSGGTRNECINTLLKTYPTVAAMHGLITTDESTCVRDKACVVDRHPWKFGSYAMVDIKPKEGETATPTPQGMTVAEWCRVRARHSPLPGPGLPDRSGACWVGALQLIYFPPVHRCSVFTPRSARFFWRTWMWSSSPLVGMPPSGKSPGHHGARGTSRTQ